MWQVELVSSPHKGHLPAASDAAELHHSCAVKVLTEQLCAANRQVVGLQQDIIQATADFNAIRDTAVKARNGDTGKDSLIRNLRKRLHQVYEENEAHFSGCKRVRRLSDVPQ